MNHYFEYGTLEMWLVYPEQHLVVVHFPDGTPQTYRKGESLTSALLAQFELPLDALFSLTAYTKRRK